MNPNVSSQQNWDDSGGKAQREKNINNNMYINIEQIALKIIIIQFVSEYDC